ncbi:biotin synthase BioB [Anaerotignum lactatifermentans]|nr:biotin synthase BioB [Anaerotignum lactatifermentans]
MTNVEEAAEKVMQGDELQRKEARWLYEQPLEELSFWADRIRSHFCGNGFDLCTIINGKSGRCSENCRFCAQSIHYSTGTEAYPLLGEEAILTDARKNEAQGVLRYSIVTSGKCLSDAEVDKMCQVVHQLRKETSLSICVSFGLLSENQFRRLKDAGVTRVHNNLETSRRNFPNICTTHTFEDKIQAIRAAQAAGLTVCSGGIMGMGETAEDRLDLAFSLRKLGIGSVPINLLNAIPGTPLEKEKPLTAKELQRIIAVYRFILPKASIRLAGGRGLLADGGRACFCAGANAAITGDMLTTAGISPETDKKFVAELGFEVRRDRG